MVLAHQKRCARCFSSDFLTPQTSRAQSTHQLCKQYLSSPHSQGGLFRILLRPLPSRLPYVAKALAVQVPAILGLMLSVYPSTS